MQKMKKLQSTNPSNYKVLGTVVISTAKEIEENVARARSAQKPWGQLSVAKRVGVCSIGITGNGHADKRSVY